MRRNPALPLLCLAVLITAQLAAQQAVPPLQPPPPAPVTTGPLTLDVVVTDKKGVPITGLQQQDFTIEIDKKPLPITSFKAVEASKAGTDSIETILLIDTVNTRFTHVAYERQEIDRFLKQNNGQLAQPVTLVILSDTGTKITPQPSRDGNQLATFLAQAESNLREIGRDTGFYGAVERFQLSTSALQRLAAYEDTRPGRKLLVWIGPGWPLLSGPEVELTAREQQQLFATDVTLTAALRKARITLSSVDPLGTADAVSYRTFFYKEFTKGVPSPNRMQIGNLALQVLALNSGGRVMNSNNDVAKEITAAVSDAQAFYTLTVNPSPAEHPNEYRTIAVTTDKPGLTPRTRTGYYAQP